MTFGQEEREETKENSYSDILLLQNKIFNRLYSQGMGVFQAFRFGK